MLYLIDKINYSMGGYMITKVCFVCKEEKEITEFNTHYNKKLKKIVFNSRCNVCKRAGDIKTLNKNKKLTWSGKSICNHEKDGCTVKFDKFQLHEKIKHIEHCNYCNIKLTWGYGKGHSQSSPTLDRVNNEKIMTLDNVQVLCRQCNTSKGNRTHAEYIVHCTNMTKLGSVQTLGGTIYV